MKLSGIMLGTDNIKQLSDFYTKILGEPVWHEGDWFSYLVGGAALTLGPHSEVKGKNTTPGRLIIVFDTDQVEAEFTRLKELGAEVVAEPYHPEGEQKMLLATLADPDGNYLQLSTPWEE